MSTSQQLLPVPPANERLFVPSTLFFGNTSRRLCLSVSLSLCRLRPRAWLRPFAVLKRQAATTTRVPLSPPSANRVACRLTARAMCSWQTRRTTRCGQCPRLAPPELWSLMPNPHTTRCARCSLLAASQRQQEAGRGDGSMALRTMHNSTDRGTLNLPLPPFPPLCSPLAPPTLHV